ncbi:RNA polymerase sigma factor [Selenomonas ruminantium]|uniref:Homeodomain-like domain-containing protein n=1 Tax=Selenomonas ruminantium TaxID=971 RepID=A0A1I0YAR7_SELRU|nr:helix-turn-helix domain-containing protein [Selenomonas ruminantium]SFB10384.1 Homeodomain-like domain-containing protein [Selenomonas ruminantium]
MAIDYLRQLVDDYNAGRVTLGDTLNRLNFLAWAEDKKPLPEDYMKIPRDPAEILIEEERAIALREHLVNLRNKLSKENWKVLVMVVRGKTYAEIGDALGISHQAVSKRLLTIRKYAEGLQEFLRRDSPIYEAGTPMVKVCYPMDAAMKNLRKCRMPEYMAECFDDTNTRCCYCEKCRRNKDNR